jgi:GntR family transcriptional regulator
MIQRNIPLSQQVANDILTSIEAGNLVRPSDGLLPSEAELSQRYNVSRATVREALSRLEQRGVILRRHGVGTFLNSQRPIIESGLERLESLDTLTQRMGLHTDMDELQIQERQATTNEARQLQISDESMVISVSRVIRIGDKRVAYLMDITPLEFLNKQALGNNFIGSVLDIFLKRGDPVLSHSLTEIATENASDIVSKNLNLRIGEPLLKLTARLFSLDGRVVDYSHSYFVPGFFRFHVVRRIDPCDL